MQISPPILILGMHRSGTSCLAGCLEEAGLYLGDVTKIEKSWNIMMLFWPVFKPPGIIRLPKTLFGIMMKKRI